MQQRMQAEWPPVCRRFRGPRATTPRRSPTRESARDGETERHGRTSGHRAGSLSEVVERHGQRSHRRAAFIADTRPGFPVTVPMRASGTPESRAMAEIASRAERRRRETEFVVVTAGEQAGESHLASRTVNQRVASIGERGIKATSSAAPTRDWSRMCWRSPVRPSEMSIAAVATPRRTLAQRHARLGRFEARTRLRKLHAAQLAPCPAEPARASAASPNVPDT